MELYLEIIQGPKKGEKFTVKDGLTIGRIGQDINLDDPKSSTLHAEVIVNSRGYFVLRDNDSRNGMIVGGKPRDKTTLRVGKKIRLGNSVLEVKQKKATSSQKKKGKSPIEVFNPDNEITRVPNDKDFRGIQQRVARSRQDEDKKTSKAEEDADAFDKVQSWNEILIEQMKTFSANIKNEKASLGAFSHIVTLKVLKGIQMGSEWSIAYGPRQFGAQSIEFPIYDKGAPNICFEIIPKSSGPQFITSYPDKVLLNDQSVSKKTLKNKDYIYLGTMIIEVNLAE